MPYDQRPRSLRASFDQAADDYDAARPGYPTALIDDVVALAELPSQASILEIGCGTGQATLPFAQRGYQLTCLDIGAALLAVARRKLAAYQNVRFEHAAFETWPGQPNTFDLVMSATAFHWIAPEVGYPKAADLLTATGSLAIFANEHQPPDPAFAADMYELEQRLVPDWPDPRAAPSPEASIAETADEIDATQLFTPVLVKTYPWSQTYSTAEFLRLQNTYSNYRSLTDEVRTALFDGIAKMIGRRMGGAITKRYLAVLYLARKRPER